MLLHSTVMNSDYMCIEDPSIPSAHREQFMYSIYEVGPIPSKELVDSKIELYCVVSRI
jgi:hypothetical protein